MSIKKALGIAYLAIVFAVVIGSLLRPEMVAGEATPDPDYFIPTNAAPLQEMNPLPLPEWAPPTFNGASPIHIAGDQVWYADGSYLWISEDGTVYSWTIDQYDI